MNAATQTEQNALTLPQRASVALGAAEHEVKLRELVLASAGIKAVTNKAGRDECHSAYMVLKNTRVAIKHTVDDVTEDAKAFTKAVKAEAERLLNITQAEEDRLQALRDQWDEAEQARKDALIAAERERVEEINDRIEGIRSHELLSVRTTRTNAEFQKCIDDLDSFDISEAIFQERTEDAVAAKADVLASMRVTMAAKVEAARIAAEAEVARLAEIARIEAERAELAKLRAEQAERERLAKIESDRIAAEQAAERRRLAEQEAELQRQRDAEASRVRAEQEARDREAAEQRRQIAIQQEQLAEQQAAFAREQEEARARAEAIARLDVDHAEALPMNVQFDADREAERACSMPAGSLAPVETIEGPSDQEIIELIAVTYGMNPADALDRLASIDFDAARVRNEVAP